MSTMVECPVCGHRVATFFINSHLDSGCSALSGRSQPSSSNAVPGTSSTKRKAASTTPAQLGTATPQPPLSEEEKRDPSSTSKRFKSSDAIEAAKPLAERVRPTCLDDFVGQEQLLGPGALLRGMIEKDRLGSCIFWGPPGTGKTTIARLIANATKSVFRELSATNASTADVRKVFDEAAGLLKLTGRRTVLFIDEIQRFNKSQQDSFLPVVEAGTISLIASTTENPSFRLNGALLSRCRVFVLNKLTPDDIHKVLLRALSIVRSDTSLPSSSLSSLPSSPSAADPSDLPSDPIDDDLLRFLASAADGDARIALSSLELALTATRDSSRPISREELKTQLRKAHLQYDRTGDHHYDTISALHKSVRGGDADAAMYWLVRMLQAGDDPLYVARRLLRMASEDLGLANPNALPQAVAAYQATQLLGMPECGCILGQVAVMLAESPKSVRTYNAYNAATALVASGENHPVPIHLRNAPTGLMKKLGYGRDYKYNPSFAHPVTQPFLPPELNNTHFLEADDSLKGKMYDEAALREWEWKNLGGKAWEGREGMMEKLAKEK